LRRPPISLITFSALSVLSETTLPITLPNSGVSLAAITLVAQRETVHSRTSESSTHAARATTSDDPPAVKRHERMNLTAQFLSGSK